MTALYRGGARNGGTMTAMPATTVDYDGLAIFLAVAEERSFSKAAKRLGVGKGTISRAIASLEETVGARRATVGSAAADRAARLRDHRARRRAGRARAALPRRVVRYPDHQRARRSRRRGV